MKNSTILVKCTCGHKLFRLAKCNKCVCPSCKHEYKDYDLFSLISDYENEKLVKKLKIPPVHSVMVAELIKTTSQVLNKDIKLIKTETESYMHHVYNTYYCSDPTLTYNLFMLIQHNIPYFMSVLGNKFEIDFDLQKQISNEIIYRLYEKIINEGFSNLIEFQYEIDIFYTFKIKITL